MDITSKSGDYELLELKITSHNGFELDIKNGNTFTSLMVYEDLFSPTMTASLTLSDPEGILNFMPIIGQEKVDLSFVTAGLEEPITKKFIISKITDLESDAAIQNYTLELASVDLISNYEEKISEYFEGSATDIAQKCWKRLSSDKDFEFEPSSDLYENEIGIIIPNMTPMRACSYLTERAFHDTYKSSSYVFFESSKSYVMKPLEMLTQSEPKNKFNLGRYKNAGIGDEGSSPVDSNMENKKAITYSFLSNFKVLDNIAHGLYNSQLTTIDFVTRTKKIHDHSFWENSKDYKYLNQAEGMDENKDPDGPIFDITGQGIQYKPKTEYLLPEIEVKAGRPMFNQEKIYLQRKFFMQLINNIKCSLTVYGDSDLSVGDTVELSLPIFTRLDLKEEWEDKYYSGKYLICAIRHRLSGSRYVSDMELVKDSFNDELPAPIPVIEGVQK
jgi:hypothetical protein|tara:strand:- start:1472 stop:2803 length:1332 start_codon:yes stop_codon:yes gene_type:complete